MATNLVIPEKDTDEGYTTPIGLNSDGLAANGFYPQQNSSDLLAGIERDASGNLILKDAIGGETTLSNLMSGVTDFNKILLDTDGAMMYVGDGDILVKQ